MLNSTSASVMSPLPCDALMMPGTECTGSKLLAESPALQVLTTQQLAGIMVHVYPFLPVLDKTLGAVAARGGVYGMDIPPAALEDLQQIAAEWGQFEAYVAHVTAQVWHDYMPFRLV